MSTPTVFIDIAISPNDRILASASRDKTHAEEVSYVRLRVLFRGWTATSNWLRNDKNAYAWDVGAIVKEAGLNDLLSDSKANKSELDVRDTFIKGSRCAQHIHSRLMLHDVRSSDVHLLLEHPQVFFDGAPPDRSHFSRPNSSAPPGGTFLGRLFHRSPSDTHDTSPSSPPDWARNLLKWRGRSGEGIELQRDNPAAVDVPYAKGKRKRFSKGGCVSEKQKMKPLHFKNSTTGSSQPPKPNVAKPSSQPQAADSSSSTTPAMGHATTTTGWTMDSLLAPYLLYVY
ncbi:hypothetical protein DFJ58DRAFT_749784 [Suillus subalutaceus]|uniref:uncharacterized protein n=1 Tax=Suillus subalutaceus TaxID=48586 RepID=UPI001B87047C|nr:uncharacterized protein DFJ58DRAFT_749784 [Suillus subalutaceus]KAG1836446.1 hypothetical protein DFJ58DRAFT_749784 [Suillus subalutaceus]